MTAWVRRLVPVWIATAAASAVGAERRPNVLLIMTDQQTHSLLGCAGNPLVKTPSLDKLAAEGARITDAVCATPFCTPTRASIRTGLWPHTHGLTYNVAPDRKVAEPRANRTRARRREATGDGERRTGLTHEQTTLDDLLFAHGYRTEHLGKWHLGELSDLRAYRDKTRQEPDRAAYATWLAAQGAAVVDRKARPGEKFVAAEGRYFVPDAILRGLPGLLEGDEPEEQRRPRESVAVGRSAVAPQAQFEAWLADRAIEWLGQHRRETFFLTYSAVPPHAPWVAPAPYYDLYDPATMLLPPSFRDVLAVYRTSRAAKMGASMGEAGIREYLRCYYAQVTMIDEQIGRLLDALRKLGLEQDTLVIFTSDHGDMQGAHGMMGKSVPAFYEENVRVPLIFRYPRTIPGGRVLHMSANSVDLMPTILDYAGLVTPRSVQGRSLRAILDGKAPVDDAPAFCERGLDGRAAMRMVRTAGWKYCAYGDGRRELFDLAKDPHESRNAADDPSCAAARRTMERHLLDWMRRTKDPAMKDLFPKSR